jgi:hypothetical protein
MMFKSAAVGTHNRERLLVLRYAGVHSGKIALTKTIPVKTTKEAEASFVVFIDRISN